MLPRIRTDQWAAGEHLTIEGPFVMDTRSWDIPNTISSMIATLPDNCVAISLRLFGGINMVQRAEIAARHKGIRILWMVPRLEFLHAEDNPDYA